MHWAGGKEWLSLDFHNDWLQMDWGESHIKNISVRRKKSSFLSPFKKMNSRALRGQMRLHFYTPFMWRRASWEGKWPQKLHYGFNLGRSCCSIADILIRDCLHSEMALPAFYIWPDGEKGSWDLISRSVVHIPGCTLQSPTEVRWQLGEP